MVWVVGRFLEPRGGGREDLLYPLRTSFPSPGCHDRRWQAQLAQQSEIFGDFNRPDE